ncbi:hypothetical protein NM688_g1015 [Phlebia brevispora]|uniref:Uncharacterized protein n=1 Tax=Phlebia brevispora TaxID=194682 RepID=A0ACC1TCH4_9APHY|nr:hypothetical protein NM688_g1015 [Phlebia brevispora]
MSALIAKMLTSLFTLFAIPSFVAALWPMPRALSTGSTALKLSSDFVIHLEVQNSPNDLQSAISAVYTQLHNDTLQRLVVGRAAADSVAIARASELRFLTISLTGHAVVRSIEQEAVEPYGSRSESYSLNIPHDGTTATLTANSTLGLFRGLTTFSQMWYSSSSGKYILDAPVSIADEPAFPHRGLSFDTARNFFPVEDILRTLDGMSWLNTLYWHVADSQSFPLEVPAFPELAEKGAYSETERYSAADVQRIVSYANERGIDVIMELDSPGHTTGIAFAYPEHIACANKSPWATYASEPPAGQLRIASNATLAFARELFASVAGMMPGTMMSSGGDEVNLPCWEDDEETIQDLSINNITIADALNQFIQEVQNVLHQAGKTPFIKSDMILTHNVPVTNDTIAVVWQSSADATSMAERGQRFIHQPSDYFYLDCGAGEWLGNDVLGNSWCDPFKTWQRAYSFDPFANLSASQQQLVLGGQMPIWSEQTSPENLDPIVWPRLASGAEVFWTGATLPDGSPRLGANATSGTQAFARINEMRYRMVDRGIRAIALQPHWCVLRAGECDLDA